MRFQSPLVNLHSPKAKRLHPEGTKAHWLRGTTLLPGQVQQVCTTGHSLDDASNIWDHRIPDNVGRTRPGLLMPLIFENGGRSGGSSGGILGRVTCLTSTNSGSLVRIEPTRLHHRF